MVVRNGEAEKNWFRSERFSYVNGAWYFETREGVIKGPFENALEAELELNFYLQQTLSQPVRTGTDY
ncbi:hypothetical protein EZI54_16225 [Marinobacter halodurans]|uniref:DUF6316 domain-containing protein n=1 Tax=Marinobacter halodurans TaxID=2528979 RepID=A0ABY1ZHK2_9GAMM|nr:DUF6316 family protein [Marinobacter halodurans]TBW52185.1 hypothetical protein EZI54_16225 [Marinobacter halodurans]